MSGVYERYRSLSDKEFFKNAISIRVEITRLMASDKVVPKAYRLMSAVPTVATARELVRGLPRGCAMSTTTAIATTMTPRTRVFALCPDSTQGQT